MPKRASSGLHAAMTLLRHTLIMCGGAPIHRRVPAVKLAHPTGG